MDANEPMTTPQPEPVQESNESTEKLRGRVETPTSPIRVRSGLRAGAELEKAGDNPPAA